MKCQRRTALCVRGREIWLRVEFKVQGGQLHKVMAKQCLILSPTAVRNPLVRPITAKIDHMPDLVSYKEHSRSKKLNKEQAKVQSDFQSPSAGPILRFNSGTGLTI